MSTLKDLKAAMPHQPRKPLDESVWTADYSRHSHRAIHLLDDMRTDLTAGFKVLSGVHIDPTIRTDLVADTLEEDFVEFSDCIKNCLEILHKTKF